MKLGRRILCGSQFAALVLALGTCGCPDPKRQVVDGNAAAGREIVALITVEGLGRFWDRNAPDDAASVLRSLPDRNGPEVFTPCPSSVPAIASLMSGSPPVENGVLDNFGSRVPAAVPLLAEQLKAAGWRTAAFVANPLLGRITALDRGFEVFDGSRANVFGSSRFYPEVRRAASLAEDAAVWIASVPAGERVFLWLHLSELGEPRLEGGEGQPPGVRDRLAAVDRAVGRLREAVRTGGNRGAVFVVGDRGQLAGPEGDLGQGFFLEPDAVAVYYAEEPFGGFELPAAGRPRVLSELRDRILGAVSAQPSPAERSTPNDAAAAVVVSSSSIPWTGCRWSAAVAVAYRGSLWIYDGEWRRSTELHAALPCPEGAVPAGVQLIARETVRRLQAIPPAGPRLMELQAAIRKMSLALAEEDPTARPRSLSERRRLVGQVQRARFLAAIGQVAPAIEALAPLLSEPAPIPSALVDALMFETLNPQASGRDWDLATRALARFGPLPSALHWSAHAALRRKNPELAEKLLQAFLERVPGDADGLYDLACIRSLSGDVAGAEAMLRAAADAGFHEWDYVEIDPDLRNLRADPRYAALRKSLGE